MRCANLSPGNPAVDIYLIGFGSSGQATVLRHVSYGDVSSYMAVSAGQYSVAMRPVGAPASSPPVVSTNFMVSAGTNYTVASLGPAAARRIEVLEGPDGRAEGIGVHPGHPGLAQAGTGSRSATGEASSPSS